jgi:Mrp family chromosome partitioning ATPase
MHEVLDKAEREYDFIVIDTPPTSVVSDAVPLVRRVGGVIVVGRLAKSTRDALTHLHNQLHHLDAPVLGVVVNALGSDAAGYGYGYGKEYGLKEGANAQEPGVHGDHEAAAEGLQFR